MLAPIMAIPARDTPTAMPIIDPELEWPDGVLVAVLEDVAVCEDEGGAGVVATTVGTGGGPEVLKRSRKLSITCTTPLATSQSDWMTLAALTYISSPCTVITMSLPCAVSSTIPSVRSVLYAVTPGTKWYSKMAWSSDAFAVLASEVKFASALGVLGMKYVTSCLVRTSDT